LTTRACTIALAGAIASGAIIYERYNKDLIMNWDRVLLVLGFILLLPMLIKLKGVLLGFIKPNEFLNNYLEIIAGIVGLTLWVISIRHT